MVKKTYVVAEGVAFTAMGHIYGAGEEIPEGAFAERAYMSKMISEGKIKEVVKAEKPVAEKEKVEKVPELEVVEADAEAVEQTGTKKSTSKGGK